MMTLGMIENWSEAGFRKVAGHGLKAIEFCYNIGQDPTALMALAGDVRGWRDATGVKVGAVGRWGTDKLAKDGAVIEDELKGSKTMIDFCAAVGAPVFNTGVNFVEGLSLLDNCNAAAGFLLGRDDVWDAELDEDVFMGVGHRSHPHVWDAKAQQEGGGED